MATLNYFDKDKQEWVAIPLGGGGGDSVVTVHDGPIPQPTAPTPQGFEDSFAGYADGLHYFKNSAALISITRAPTQTTIVMNGEKRSVARIVKSDQGLPTRQNPSTVINSMPDGKWMMVESDELDKPFGNAKAIDLFSLDLSGLVTKPELAAAIEPGGLIENIVAELSREPAALSNWMRVIVTSPDFTDGIRGIDHQHSMQDIPGLYSSIEGIGWKLDDRYTKGEVDTKLDQIKDFSIANDNNLLAGLTALQNTVAAIGTGGTEVVDVLNSIKGAKIEPEIVSLAEAGIGYISWGDESALGVANDGDLPRPYWNAGGAVDFVALKGDLSAKADLNNDAQRINAGTVTATTFRAGSVEFIGGGDEWRVGIGVDGSQQKQLVLQKGPIGTPLDFIVVRADLTPYAKLNDPNQAIFAKGVLAEGFAFDLASGLRYLDTGEGYGKRLVFAHNSGGSEQIETLVYASDLGNLPQPPTEWTNLPLEPGWTAVANNPLQYRLNNGNLELRGEVSFGSVLQTETYNNAGRLPVGFRPQAMRSLIVPTGGGSVGAIATLYVRLDGFVQFCPRLTPASSFSANVVVPGVI